MRLNFQRTGFTLLEMSIVIVIVGLIAGSIVGLQSYLANARFTTAVNEARYYINAFNQFQHTYTAVPGDMSTASNVWPTAGNGDGNGLIRAPLATNNTAEYWYAFQHLADAGMIQGTFTGATGAGGTAQAVLNSNVPGSSVDGTAFLFDHPDTASGIVSGDSLYFDGTYFHVLRLAGLTASDTGIPAHAFLDPKQAYELDAKFDDGNPATGWITTPKHSALTDCTTSDTVSSTAYNVAPASPVGLSCFFIFKVQ